MRKIDVLVVGSGQMAKAYLTILTKEFNKISLALVSGDSNRGVVIKNEFNHVEIFDNLENALLECEYDKAIVCTSESKVLGIANILKSHKISILFEKPLGVNYSESKKIASLLKNSNSNFLALNRRFYDGILELKKIVRKSQFLGAVILDQQAEYEWYPHRLKAVGGDMVYSNSVHLVDLCLFLLDQHFIANGVSAISQNEENVSISNYQILDSNTSASVSYMRVNNAPGSWQIFLYFEKYFIRFDNMESFKVFDSDRNVILEISSQDGSHGKPGFYKMLNAFLYEEEDIRLQSLDESLLTSEIVQQLNK
jgi:predicted dehydrogenase